MPGKRDSHACPPSTPEPGERATSDTPTIFTKALQSGELADLHDTPINRLIQQAAAEVGARGVIDELGALRIVLTRLVNEQDDLDALTANVTRVASVALRAARTQQQISDGLSEWVADAVALIHDEVRRDHEAQAANPGSN